MDSINSRHDELDDEPDDELDDEPDDELLLHSVEMLMLHGVDRHCLDCGAVTIFLPVDAAAGDQWVCTACDGAVLVTGLAA